MSAQPVILYMHIPKAGGCTLAEWLYEQIRASSQDSEVNEEGWLSSGVFYYPSGYVRGPYPRDIARIERVLPRKDLRAVVGHFALGIHRKLSQPFKYITMLREPVERVISLYQFEKLVEAKYGQHQGIRMPADMTLERFAESPLFCEVDNGQTRRISGLSAELGGCTKGMLERAKQNLSKYFAVVGTTERFDETLLLLKRTFSWGKDLFYYPKNSNPNRITIECPPKKAIDAILARNELDSELYLFATELMESAISSHGAGFQSELEEFKLKKKAWYESIASRDPADRKLASQTG